MPGLFVTGTSTEVGKTYVTSLIARQLVGEGLRVGVYKPVASGCVIGEDDQLVSEDATSLWEAAGRPLTLEAVCPQRFKAPLAPNRAAACEQKTVDSRRLREGVAPWLDGFDFVLVEGAGGLLSPLSDEDYNADLAIDLHASHRWPLLVVAANTLGTINATLQTIITANAYRSGVPVAGVVLSQVDERPDPSAASNHLDIARSSPAPLLADVRWQGGFDQPVDWLKVAKTG
ncbi:MAG: dethiobiotin synthase [Planctomycetota bacterium]